MIEPLRRWIGPGLALCALIVAFVTRAEVNRPTGAPSPARDGAAGPDGSSTAKLEQDVARLAQRLYALERSVAAVSGRVPDEVPSADSPPDTVAELRSDVDALLTGEALETERGRERLRQVIKDEQHQHFAERQRARQESRDRWVQAQLDELSAEARLSDDQASRLRRLIASEGERRAEIIASLGGAPITAEASQELRRMRSETENTARSVLSEDQHQAFLRMRRDEVQSFLRSGR
jgi:hypothetical protein